jgi:type II secretory pathway component PulJ
MKQSATQTPRNGAAVLVALIVMALLAVLMSVVAVQVASQRRLIQQRHHQLQATWLARAGVELAVARLLENAADFHEDKLDLVADSKLNIVVKKSEPDFYLVTVEAGVGAQNESSVVRTESVLFRRTEVGGLIRLQAVSPDKKKHPS